MTRSRAVWVGVGILFLVLLGGIAGPRLVSGQPLSSSPVPESALERISRTLQNVEGQAKEINEVLRRTNREQQARSGGIVDFGTLDSWRWAVNPVNGTVLRIDQRDGSVKMVFRGRPGQWTPVATYASYCWLFSAGGSVVRVDIRDGDTRVLHDTQPGIWDVAAGAGGEKIFAVVVNRDTGETIRLNRVNGDTLVVLKPFSFRD
jgi:hypothetical protein